MNDVLQPCVGKVGILCAQKRASYTAAVRISSLLILIGIAGCSPGEAVQQSELICDFHAKEHVRLQHCLGENFPSGSQLSKLEAALRGAGYRALSRPGEKYLRFVNESSPGLTQRHIVTVGYENGLITSIVLKTEHKD